MRLLSQKYRICPCCCVASLIYFGSLAALVIPGPAFALEIRGRVLLEADAGFVEAETPFPGARVELLPVLSDWERALEVFEGGNSAQESEPVAITRSGPQGYYELQAPKGLWQLRVSAPDFVAMERLLPLVESRNVKSVSLRPDVGRPVRFIASTGTGHPPVWILAVPAASARSSPENWHPARFWVWQKAEDRTPRVSRAEGEEVAVRVFAPGYEPVDLRLPLDDPEAAVRLHPEPLRRIGFTGVDPSVPDERDAENRAEKGSPLKGAFVLLGAGVPGAGGVRDRPFPLARTDSEGRAEVLVPRDRTVLLTLLSPDGRRSIQPFEPQQESPGESSPGAGEEVLEWPLPAGQSVVGRALDDETGDPIAGALVWFQAIPAGWVQTDRQGSYHLAAPSTVHLVLRAEAAGYRGVEISGRLEGEPLRGGPRELGAEVHEAPILSLAPVATITGNVKDEVGGPVVGADVGARASATTPGPPPDWVNPVESGADGGFRLSELTPGVPYRVTARAKGFAPAEVDVPPLERGTGVVGSQSVVIVLRRGRTVYGTVVDDGGEPVPGARVALLWHADTMARKRFVAGRRLAEGIQVFKDRTGKDGSFTVVDLPAGRFELVAQAEGFAPYETPGVELAPEETSKDLGRLELSPGLALEGQVTDRLGRPVVGAEVRIQRRFESASFPGAMTRSDPDGRFRLDHLVEDLVFDLHVRHPEYATRVIHNVTARDQGLHVELERPAVVTGRVVSSLGEPVAHAWVGAKPEDAVDSWVLYSGRRGVDPTTRTDAEGRFQLPDVEPGQVRLSVEARGFRPYARSGLEILPGTETEVEVVLEPGATVRGRVLSAEGHPLPGISVQGAGLNTHTDPEGRFRLVGVPPGTHPFLAWDDERGRIRKTVEVPPEGAEVELVFPPGYPVTGRVVDPEDEPVPGALVRLEPATEETRTASSPRGGLTDRSGDFGFSDVPPGSYRLLARREGLSMVSTAPVVEVTSRPVRNLRITLGSGGVVQGQVLGLEPGEAGGLVVEARGPGPVRRGEVSGSGNYRIEGLSPGDWLVTAEVRGSGRRAQDRVRLRDGDNEIRLDLELGKGLALSGRVRENGEPLVDAQINLFGPGGDRVASARTDRSGSFRVEGLEPGTHGLEVVSFGREIRQRETLSIERDRQIEIDLATGFLSGQVVDSTGSPVARTRVLLEPLAGPAQSGAPRWLTTKTDGGFSAARLLAGRYRVTVRGPGGPEVDSAISISEITIPAGSGVEAWVVELPAVTPR